MRHRHRAALRSAFRRARVMQHRLGWVSIGHAVWFSIVTACDHGQPRYAPFAWLMALRPGLRDGEFNGRWRDVLVTPGRGAGIAFDSTFVRFLLAGAVRACTCLSR